MPVEHPKLSISGDIGSGKSAVGRILCEKTGQAFYSTGSIQREIAARRGMTTLELNQYSETNREIDDEIDDFSRRLGERDESFILDSRLAWHFVPHSFKVYLKVEPEIAARRILGDARQSEQYADLDAALTDIRARRDSEIRRFRELYGVELGAPENYDLVVDTSHAPPETIAETILRSFRRWIAGESFEKFPHPR